MKRAVVLALTLAVLVACIAPAVFGQGRPRRVDPSQTVPPPSDPGRADPKAPGGQQDDDDPVRLEGALIEVPIVASDRSGHYVPQLRQQDFRVLEDGVQQDITFFSAERVPIHVAIVMDTSGSTRDTIYDIQEAAIGFISQLEPRDQVIIVSFANQVIVEQEFTNDRRLLEAAIRRTQANGSTKLYDATYLTVAERLRQVDGRKAMIILSDGEDTASSDATYEEAVNVCSESDVVVYGIRYPESAGTSVFTIPNTTPPTFPGNGPYPNGYPQPRNRQRRNWPQSIPQIPWPKPFVSNWAPVQYGGRNPGTLNRQGAMGGSRFMETITANTGGTLFYADQVGNVSSLLALIAEELRHVYVVGYSPSNSLQKGGYRRITVQVPGRPDLAIRHRLGYQAESYKQQP